MGRRYAVLYLMKIELYNFAKKKNSTARPDPQTAKLADGDFQAKQDICNPIIRLITTEGKIGGYNYAFIHELGDRYYFVNKIVSVAEEVSDIYLEVDPLATYKNVLLEQTFYVSRSSSDYDTRVIDRNYPAIAGNGQFSQTVVDWLVAPETENHVYSIGIIGGKGTTGITYGLIAEQYLRQLMTFMFTADNFSAEISDEVVKTFFNPSQYIVGCNYIPFNYSYYGQHSAQNIKLGWFDTSISYSVPQYPVLVLPSVDVGIPYPITDDLTDFRNFSPYSTYRLLLPFVGYVPINADLLIGNNTLTVSGVVDIATGQGMIRVIGKEQNIVITELSANMLPPIAIAQSHVNYSLTAGIGALLSAGAQSWNYLTDKGADFAGKMKSVGDGLMATENQVSSIGTQGNLGQMIFNRKIVFQAFRKSLVRRDISDFGAPLMAPRQLKNLSGYCEVISAHFQSGRALVPELDAVNSYLEGGFYIE